MIKERRLRWNGEKDRSNGTCHALPTAGMGEKNEGNLEGNLQYVSVI